MHSRHPSRQWFRGVTCCVIVVGMAWGFAVTLDALAEQAAVPTPVPAVMPTSEPVGAFPTPGPDACLHCHTEGGEHHVWNPLSRWSLFGAAGLVFAFGIFRSASLWRERQPWRPLRARAAQWIDQRYDVQAPLQKALRKPVPRYATHWMYCLGGITFTLFLVQAVTGIMLAFYYKPTPHEAYESIQYIMTQVRFGAVVRGIHHWAANGMIITCVLHMLRVFITGAYKPPREMNWVVGVLLLLVTLAFGFTGYLLIWDQRAFWATTVGSEMAGTIPIVGEIVLLLLRGGWTVTGATLSRFYAIHMLVLPAAIGGLMGLHFLMVRRQGIARPL